jgi:hypothetical protein
MPTARMNLGCPRGGDTPRTAASPGLEPDRYAAKFEALTTFI